MFECLKESITRNKSVYSTEVCVVIIIKIFVPMTKTFTRRN